MINHIITSSIVILFVLIMSYAFEKRISPCVKYSLWLLVVIKLLLPVPDFESKYHILNSAEKLLEAEKQIEKIWQTDEIITENKNGGEEIITSNNRFEEISKTDNKYIIDESGKNEEGADTVTESEMLLNEHFQKNNEENQPLISGIMDLFESNSGEEKSEGISKVDSSILKKVSSALIGLYIVGVIAYGGIFLYGNIRFRKYLTQKGKYLKTYKNKIPVYRIEEYYGACLYGGFMPVIIVGSNKELSIEQQHMIMTHEYVHYLHGDHIWSVIRCICVTLYWYNPLVWIAAIVSRRDGELACDEGTLKRIGKKQRIAYGQSLLEIAARTVKINDITLSAFFYSTTAAGGKEEMKKRITMIARETKTSVAALIAVVILSVGCIGCNFGTPSIKEGDHKEETTNTESSNEEDRTKVNTENNGSMAKEEIISNTEDSENGDKMVEKYNLHTEPQKDKVCIRVQPSEVRERMEYYHIPTEEEQEELKQMLNSMEVASKEKQDWVITQIKTGKLKELREWNFVYNDKYYEVYGDGYFSSLDLENEEKIGPAVYYEQNQELYEKISSILLRDLNYKIVDISTIKNITSATLEVKANRTNYQFYEQTITDSESLKKLELWFSNAKFVPGEYDCENNGASLLLITASGEEIRMSLAADDCTVFAVNGVYYDYKPADKANEGWYSNNVYELFDKIPNEFEEEVVEENAQNSSIEKTEEGALNKSGKANPELIDMASENSVSEISKVEVAGTDSSAISQKIQLSEVNKETASEAVLATDDEANDEGGKFAWPTISTTISTNFGTREHPITGEKIVIDYIGIVGNEGDSVYAVADGTITDVGFDSTKGNYIVLETRTGEVVTYGHLMGSKVPDGQEVKAGEIIGLMGKTGTATGVFLSVSVEVDGEMVDAMNYFQK